MNVGDDGSNEPGLFELIRSDFRRQARMFGWRRVPASESFWLTAQERLSSQGLRVLALCR